MSNELDLSALATEQINPASVDFDTLPTEQMLAIINNEDKKVALSVEKELPRIAAAVDAIVETISTGGRLFYTGAGTSGRLGVLDASECPPTFNVPPEMVQGLIAGGDYALRDAVDGARVAVLALEREVAADARQLVTPADGARAARVAVRVHAAEAELTLRRAARDVRALSFAAARVDGARVIVVAFRELGRLHARAAARREDVLA